MRVEFRISTRLECCAPRWRPGDASGQFRPRPTLIDLLTGYLCQTVLYTRCQVRTVIAHRIDRLPRDGSQQKNTTVGNDEKSRAEGAPRYRESCFNALMRCQQPHEGVESIDGPQHGALLMRAQENARICHTTNNLVVVRRLLRCSTQKTSRARARRRGSSIA